MIISTDIIYIVILLLSVLLLSIIILITLFLKAQGKYIKLRTAGKDDGDSDPVIDTAQKVSEEIIRKAQNQALKIVESSKINNEKYDAIVDSAIAKIINSWGGKSTQVFEKNLNLLDSELKKLIQEIYNKENKSISEYKDAKIKEIDERVEAFVRETGKRILSREISLNDHKKFILEALQMAHQNGQFN